MHKIITYQIEIVQDDIDYLKFRALKSLEKFHKAKNHLEKTRQWLLFEAYNALYESNKDRVKP